MLSEAPVSTVLLRCSSIFWQLLIIMRQTGGDKFDLIHSLRKWSLGNNADSKGLGSKFRKLYLLIMDHLISGFSVAQRSWDSGSFEMVWMCSLTWALAVYFVDRCAVF